MMGRLRGHTLLRAGLLLLVWLQAGSSFGLGVDAAGVAVERHVSSGRALSRHLLQALAPSSGSSSGGSPNDAPTAAPTKTPTTAPTPTPVATPAPTPTPTKPATSPPLTPSPTTVAPVATNGPAPTSAPTTAAPTDTPIPELTTLPPAVTPAPATLPPLTPAPTTAGPTPAPTPLATTAAPLPPAPLTLAPTLAPIQPPSPPPGKNTPSPLPSLVPATPPPTPPATSSPPGNSLAPLTVNESAPAPALVKPVVVPNTVNETAPAPTLVKPVVVPNTVNDSAPAPALVTPVVALAEPLAPAPIASVTGASPGMSPTSPLVLAPPDSPAAAPQESAIRVGSLVFSTPPKFLAAPLSAPLPPNATSGRPPPPVFVLPSDSLAPGPAAVLSPASPACLPGTPSCDPLVVKLLLSNTDYGTLSQYLFAELASQLGLQSNQFQISAVTAGAGREFNVTFYILPVSGFNISAPIAQNVSRSLSTHTVKLDQALFGNYTFFYAVPNSALEIAPTSPPVAPAPAPVPAPAPAPGPANSTVIPPVNTGGGGGGGGGSGTIIAVAAAVGGAAVLAVAALVLCCCLCRKKKVEEQDDAFSEYSKTTSVNTASALLTRPHEKPFRTLSSASMPSDSLPRPSSARVFTYEELADATNGWDPMYLLGEGGFGKVYKGVLKDGIKVAVKKLTVGGHQGDREFQVEVEMLSRLHHRHLVKLIGYYYRPEQQLLCYELVMNGSLENHLHGQGRGRRPPGAMWQPLALDWDARMKIAIGAARGLAYLHEDCQPTVIHRDMKASNILLEDNFHAKVADFGLAKIAPDNRSDYLTTRVMGTFGYVAPEYAMTGHIMVKSDVYSYGVVLLELLTGRKPVDMSQPQGQENLVTYARPLLSDPDRVEDLVDPRLGDAFPFEDLLKVATIALACVHPDPARRPHMGEVVQKLRMLQRSPANGAESHQSDDCATGRDMETLASTLSGPLPAYTQSQPFPGGYMSTAYPRFPMHRSMELPPHTTSSRFQSENMSVGDTDSMRSQSIMLDHDQLARTTVFSEGLEEGR